MFDEMSQCQALETVEYETDGDMVSHGDLETWPPQAQPIMEEVAFVAVSLALLFQEILLLCIVTPRTVNHLKINRHVQQHLEPRFVITWPR